MASPNVVSLKLALPRMRVSALGLPSDRSGEGCAREVEVAPNLSSAEIDLTHEDDVARTDAAEKGARSTFEGRVNDPDLFETDRIRHDLVVEKQRLRAGQSPE
jgi:hypothetical protein